MFPSRTDSYNDNTLIGTDATTATSNFDTAHPIYRLISQFSVIRQQHAALSKGRQVVRHYEQDAGIFAVSRFDPEDGREYLLVFNSSGETKSANVTLAYDARAFETLAGTCPAAPSAPGSAAFSLPAFGWSVCRVSESAE